MGAALAFAPLGSRWLAAMINLPLRLLVSASDNALLAYILFTANTTMSAKAVASAKWSMSPLGF